jgi:radical SAM superfamily enzyme YgiQ (UPF0313 family)
MRAGDFRKPVRVLLVNSNTSRSVAPAAPIGLAYVATATSAAGHDVAAIDLLGAYDTVRRLQNAIYAHRPDLVGVSVRNIDNVLAQRHEDLLGGVRPVIETIRRCTSSPIVLGGPAISILGAASLDKLGADYAIVGEGEEAMPALASALENGTSLDDVPGLCRTEGSDVVRCAPSRAIVFGASGMERWIDWTPYDRAGATWPIQTKRGCSLGCSYCTYPLIEGSAHRHREAGDVVDEIEKVSRLVRPRAFEFVDSTFTVPTRHAAAICEEILARGLRVRLATMGGNPLGIDLPLLALMKRAGFNSIMVTPESASDAMLARYHKGFDVRQVEIASDAVRASGLSSAWFFMLGGPGETKETVAETLGFIRHHLARPDCLVVVATGVRVFPGSALAREIGHDREVTADFAYYLSPTVDETWILDRINETIARCPNVVHACEDGSSMLQRVTERALCALGHAPPYWRHMPRLLGMQPFPWLRARYPAAGAPVEGRA